MSLCVNTSLKEFKDTAKRLDISENSLETIVHEFINAEGNVNAFPSDYFILSKTEGQPFDKLTENEQKLIDLKYKNPIVVDSFADAQAVMNDMAQYFDPKHIGLKETYNGKFSVSLAGLKKTSGTPIKEKYKGKLIFAQSGTGKSRIADNVNVIDADTLLADVLGTSVESAIFAFANLDNKQKTEVTNEYRQRIREELRNGHTVLTASPNMIDAADVVVYNESVELTNTRTSAQNREGGNRYSNSDKAEADIIKAKSAQNKEVISLDSEHFLSDYLLTNPSYEAEKSVKKADSLNEAVSGFLQDFGITVNELRGYNGQLPLFDAVNRVINAKKDSDITDAMGYAVAFMMQNNPTVKKIFIREALNQIFPGSQTLFSEDFVDRVLLNDNEKSIRLPIGVAKVAGRKYVTPSEIYSHIPGKEGALKSLGNDIAKTLRDYYSGKENKNFAQNIWEVIKEFFKKVTQRGYYQERLNFINSAADAIIRKDPSLMRGAEYKPGSTTKASLMNLDSAFAENPFEAGIVEKLSELGISLAGSASIRAAGTIYRPSNNPLHDIDFAAPEFRSKAQLTKALNEAFPHIEHFRSIRSRDNASEYTESYLLLDRPFHLGEEQNRQIPIIDESNNEVIGKIDLKDNEIVDTTIPELKGKLLDFFINTKGYEGYGDYSLTINGKEYLLADARDAFEAKVKWQRRKDLWDWSRFTPNENYARSNAAFNIDGKSLRDFLYQKGLISAFDPLVKDSRKKDMYVVKGDGTYSISSQINQIYTTLRRNNIPADAVSFDKTDGGGVRIKFNEAQDAIARMQDKNLANVNKVVDFLQSRIPALKDRVRRIGVKEAGEVIGRPLKRNENSFIKNGVVYLVGERFNEDIAIEECLHPFVATLQYENPFLYGRLKEEALRTFPRLWQEILGSYEATQFTHEDRINELITQSLSRHFREAFNDTAEGSRKTFMQYVKDFVSWFRNLFYRVNPVTGNQIIDLETLTPLMSFKDLAGLINTSDTEFSVSFEEKTRFNKERLTISPEDSKFITESIIVPGISSETIQKIESLWNDSFGDNDFDSYVTIPYSEWKGLGVDLPLYTGKEGRVVEAKNMYMNSLDSILDGVREDFESDSVVYNKQNKTITLPKVALNIAKIVREAQPMTDQLIQAWSLKGNNITPKWNYDISDIVWDFLVQEELSFEDFLSLIGGEYYYKDSRQLQLFDEYGNPTEAAIQEDGLSTPQAEPVRAELEQFQRRTSKTISQLDNLLDSDLMSNTEVRHIAEQTVYFISDAITEFLETPEKIFDAFPKLAIKDGKPMTDEQKKSEVERIRKMSRVELAKYITPEKLIQLVKDRYFTPPSQTDHVINKDSVEINTPGNDSIGNISLMRKARLIRDNFDAIIRFANDTFVSVESFSIVSNNNQIVLDENATFSPDFYSNFDNFDNTSDFDAVVENEGSLQEHWQIESRTLDVLTSMSQLVKQALSKCFQIRINENGQEENIKSEFGIAERLNAKDATASILRWTRGAESLSHMVQMLEAKSKENPWVNQIISKLKDTSGQESDFQSQFYGVFAKAFQPYSIIIKERNEKTGKFEYKSISVNQHPALTDAAQGIEVAYKTNVHPLFDNGKIRKDALETLTSITNDLVDRTQKSLEENNIAEVVDLLTKAAAALGYNTDASYIYLALDSTNTFYNMVNSLKNMVDNLNNAIDVENYNPFKFSREKGSYSISGYLRNFLAPITEKLEETAVSSFYDSGKMYQSYVTPSYLTTLMNHFTSEDGSFQQFLENEYGQYEWFRNADGTWRLGWLEKLDQKSQKERKDLFKHKVQLNFNKHNYMKNMSDIEYALSIFSEFFSEYDANGIEVPVWYRVPMMSNKPSSEFIRMIAYVGKPMEYLLTNEFHKIFDQELSRIQAVEIRGYDKANPNFIKSFDKNGKKFMMLDFFNKYLKGGKEENSELGKLINKALREGTPKLTVEEQSRLSELVDTEIKSSMNNKAASIIREWKANGIFEGAKQIANIGEDDAVVERKLKEFIWNDTLASMSILELTVTDPAFYKDAEDLQKRLAQIHAPGIRANVEATDYEGRRVTDGKFRTVLLKDFDNFISNIKSNLRIVFDRKLSELERIGVSKEDSRYKAEAAVYENIIEQFNHINVADAEGYSSPTSYRKKAFIFGKWSRSAEDIYQKLKEGDYNYNDLKTAFQPLKPFVYGQISRPGINAERSDIATPLTKLKVPVQFKNSEYLLIMADAILQGEDTGKPNLLRAIFEVMEESAALNPEAGIDTIQFESTCKSGLQAPIDINKYYNAENGEALAKRTLEEAIYKNWKEVPSADGTSTIRVHTPEYNTDNYVYEVPFENYAIQQEVPEHFKNHSQAHGSQIRYIIPSDLETVDSEGNPVTYNYFDRGVEKKLSADEFKEEYERNIAANIQDSLNELSEQLGIGDYALSKRDKNIALSKVLLEEIFSSPRYGVELAYACTVNDATGEFNIPLGDPIQSKRIEQLINSVVKNRINKQEIAGGPVVQVSNFGTSRELNIRFNKKGGGLLMTRAEFEKTAPKGKSYDIDAAYKKYIEENQAGIAYYEIFAPIYANELFEKFADKEGNIDIQAIEMINPDLLKMIGYRIPTEDKYSMAPLKIVGFLPREAGDGIMLPNDITLLTGSDFDVDKFYLMRKEIDIASRRLTVGSITEDNFIAATQEFTKGHREQLKNHLKEVLYQESSKEAYKGRIQLTPEEEQEVINKVSESAESDTNYRLLAENRRHEARLETLNNRAEQAREALGENPNERLLRQINRATERSINRENEKHEENVARFSANGEYSKENRVNRALERARENKLNEIVNDFLNNDIFVQRNDALFNLLKKAYIDYMFHSVEATQGTTYRNNKIVDMSWAVLTNETTASKMLTPGGFEPEKRMGYIISAYQNPSNDLSWDQLSAIKDIEELKSLCYTDKNLCFIDTHLQFYKQNSAASTALGMSAVQKVAHAVLESNGFSIDVSEILDFSEDEMFSIMGKDFFGRMEIDRKYNDADELIGRTLGEFVAMFADAVKDPVANLMNINSTTMPLVTALVRLGMPFEQVALFISQPIIKKVLALYNSENVTNFVTLEEVINRQINEIEEATKIDDNSTLKSLNTLTKEELITNLRPIGADFENITDYKVLKFFKNIDKIAKALKGPTYATRFNSISNAVGPLVIDNLIMEYKAMKSDFEHFYDIDGNHADFNSILAKHPILNGFYQTLDISEKLLDGMPANSKSFRDLVFRADSDIQNTIFSDRKTLSELSDFFQSYLLIASGAIPVEATPQNKHQGLKYYLEQFPKDFMKGNAKELFKGNTLVDAIKVDVQKGRVVLKVDTTGLTTQDKEKLSDGWYDLYRSGERGQKLAEHLFYYNFWRTGIGFSPKSFMALFPTRLKSKISGYNQAFTVHSDRFARNVVGQQVLDQFVQNNADNNKLVPKVKIGDGNARVRIENGKYVFEGENYGFVKNKYYIKIRLGNKDIILKRVLKSNERQVAEYTELKPLGNNGEYFEASTRYGYTPLNSVAEVKQQNNEGQMQQITNNEAQVNDAPVVEDPSIEKQKKRAIKIQNMLIKMFMTTGRTEEQAKEKIKQYKEMSRSEQDKFKSSMKKFIAKKFDDLGIKYDDKLVEEMYNELC